MDLKINNKIPSWYKSIEKNTHFSVLTNDLDSLAGCQLLKDLYGVEIGAFYDFSRINFNSDKVENKKPIWVDCDLTNGLIFGNHVTLLKNENAVNLNSDITLSNYCEKYGGSTYLMMLYLYKYDFSKLNDRQLMFILAIDGAYLGYYIGFKNSWKRWMSQIFDTEVFKRALNIMENKTLSSFERVEAKYKTKELIRLSDDKTLRTKIKLDEISKKLKFKIDLPFYDFPCVRNISDFSYVKKAMERLEIKCDIKSLTTIKESPYSAIEKHKKGEIYIFSSAILDMKQCKYSTPFHA